VYGALNIDCAAKEVAMYKAAVKAEHKKELRIKLQSKLNIKGMKPCGLSVEIGLVPKIVVKFVPA